MEEIKNRVEISRKLCGCYACCGPRDAGGHTIAGGKPRTTPASCLAAQVFVELSKPVLTEGRIAEKDAILVMAGHIVGTSSKT